MQETHSDIAVRSDKKPPRTKKYPFEKLTKRGQSFFLTGADAHRVRQAARSYQRHHPKIAKSGDKLRVLMDQEAEDDYPLTPLINGVTVFRVKREE